MLQFLWLARLRDQWLGKVVGRSRKRSRPATRRRLYHRLELERLENRIVPTITLQNSFQGINLDNSSGGWVPPDTQGAAGPNSYVETTNATVAVYGKTNGATIAQDSLSDFFFTKGGLNNVGGLADAFSGYDSLAGRFIVGDIDSDFSSANTILLAVSKSNNPTTLTKTDWFFYEISTAEPGVGFQDYPGNIGYNDGAVVITENSFGGPFHVLVNSISINALTSGATLTKGTNYFQTDFNGASLRPATMQDSTSPNDPMWFVEEGTDLNPQGQFDQLNVVKMTGVLSSSPTFTTTNLAVNPYSTAVPQLNPDGSVINGNTDSRIMNASMQNGLIVAAHQVSDLAGDLDKVQWYEIDTTGGTPSLKQEGDVSGGTGTYYAYPGIAINSTGSIGMSYISSGTFPGMFMSTYITGRNPSDPAGTMEPSKLAMAGTVLDNDGREGDMSAINVDSDGSFWIANEIATFNPVFSANSWGTDIAHFKLNTNVSTKANSASAIFSSNAHSVALSATVTDINTPSNKVNEGTVTFTIKNGNTVIGTAQGAVTGGTANANFTVPAGLAAGTYTIAVSYTDNLGTYLDVSDTNATLSISPAQMTTAANNFSAAYSPNQQTLALTATLTDLSIPTDKVSEGVVTFTVTDSNNKTVGKAQGAVSNGTTTANFNLPAGQPIGTYTITVAYADPGLGNFINILNTGATLTLSAANIITTASNISTAYSPNAQTVKLNAIVADASVPTDTVGEGTVTFTVKDSKGNTLGTVQGAVSSGLASANFNLSAGQPLGSYNVLVSYSDSGGSGNFIDSGDTPGTLSVVPANVITATGNVNTAYSANSQNLALSASVTDASIPSDTVNEGVVTFTIKDSGGKTVGTAQGNVTGGTANTSFTLPAGQALGSYTIAVSYQDSLGNFSDSGDTPGTLTIGRALVTTTASKSNLTFSTAAQTVTLNATVADVSIPSDKISEGIVTFTLEDGTTAIGNAYGNVTSGTASATFNWLPQRPAGTYTIAVSYQDSLGNYIDSGDTNNTLAVAAANVTTTVTSSPKIIVSSNSQTVTLSATVADTSFPSDIVNEGAIAFTVKDGGGNTVGSPVQGTVTSGAASAVFTVPAGQAVGSYSIIASYSDSLKNFSDSGSADTPGTLTIAPANVITTANSASAIFSSNGQTLTLSASVANTSVPANTVSEGTVTFTITDSKSNTVVSKAGNVSGGTASTSVTLPPGQAAGNYTINVSYQDGSGLDNFTDAGDNSAALTITPANAVVKANSVTTAYSPNLQTLALSASVTNTSVPSDKINEGIVTFTITSGSTTIGTAQGTVTSGTANASFSLPAGQGLGSYTIGVSYSDSAGNIFDSGDTSGTLTVTPANVTVKANNVPAVYNGSKDQTLSLSATVADASIPSDTVGEGIVTFTISTGTTVLGSVQGSVTGGTANANFNLAAGQAAGKYTIAVNYTDSTGRFLDGGDTGATLTVAPANVTVKANSVSAAYSPNARVLALGATVTDTSIPSDTVSQGIVTFTVTSGGTTVGTATGLVSGGKASAGFNLPAGQALGTYTIAVSYNNSAGNFTDSGDTAGALTITPASVTTKANNVSTGYNLNSQTVGLSATVSNASVPGDTVTTGVVTFTISNGGGVIGSVQGTVTNGLATASAILSAGFPAGNYTIAVSYTDSQGRYVDSGDINGTLTVQPASVTTTAVSTSTTYNAGAQTVALSAAVTDPGPAINAVSEGIVTFTIKVGSAVVGSVQAVVNNGAANANFTLPPGLAAGSYTIAVSYGDSFGNFADTGDNNATLTVGTAATTTQIIAAFIAPNYSNLTVSEILAAHVSSSSPVTSGIVTFVLSGKTITANVDSNGVATITVTLPMLTLLGPQSINVNYADPGHNLQGSSTSQTASWQLSNPLIPTTTKFTDKGEVVTMDLFGLVITFTNGVLTEMNFDGIDIVFSYSASNQLIGVTVDGMNLLT